MTQVDSESERLTSLVEDVGPAILAYFERRVAVREDAADLLGETLLVAWRRVDVVPKDSREARLWLFGVARHVLSNHARGVRRRLQLADALRQELARSEQDGSSTPQQDAVVDAIAALPTELAEIVRLIHWDGLKLVGIAEIEGISASTVQSRYARARELLERALFSEPVELPHP